MKIEQILRWIVIAIVLIVAVVLLNAIRRRLSVEDRPADLVDPARHCHHLAPH